MNALGLVLGEVALVGVGVGVGAHLAGRRIHHPRDLEQIAHLAGQLVTAEEIIRGLTDAERYADGWPTAPVPVPPQKWVALQEAREHWEMN